jgi:pyridoxal 5'-phosphate synthase pdxT subunit
VIGVLALQGDFEAHLDALARAGASARPVRDGAGILSSSGLVLPGGESTAFRKLMEGTGIEEAIVEVARRGDAVLGTCAGAILLARDLTHPAGRGLGLLPMTVARNAYGRQVASAVVPLTDLDRAVLGAAPLEAIFIRAPRITSHDDDVEVLARRGEDPVLVRRGRILAATFHPELTPDHRVLDLFLSLPAAA